MTSNKKHYRLLVRGMLLLLGLVILGGMFWIGQGIPYSEQQGIYSVLLTVAGIMFTVFGLWIGLLYPELRKKVFGRGQVSPPVIENTDGNDKDNVDRQADHLLQPFFASLFILLATFIVYVVGPILARVSWLVPIKEILRGISYAFIGVLAFLQLRTIFGAMKITDGLKSTISRGIKRRDIKNRIRQNRK